MESYLEKHFSSLGVIRREYSFDYDSTKHMNSEIIYVFSGQQMITIGEEQYLLKEGEAAFVLPNVPHSYQKVMGKDGENTESLNIIFSIHILKNNIPDIENYTATQPFISRSKVRQDTKMALERIEYAENLIEEKAWVYLILANFLPEVGLVRKSSADELIDALVFYVDEYFYEPLTLEYLAKKFSYHPSYISHLFCDKLKMPFRSYLNFSRCDHAAWCLKCTEKSVTEIALECGFKSLNVLERCFKKVYGVSPLQYKKSPSEYKSSRPLEHRVIEEKSPFVVRQNKSTTQKPDDQTKST